MSQIPDQIELEHEDSEGFDPQKTDAELLHELIVKFNELTIYLDSISERL